MRYFINKLLAFGLACACVGLPLSAHATKLVHPGGDSHLQQSLDAPILAAGEHEALAHEGEGGAEGAEEQKIPELPNLFGLIHQILDVKAPSVAHSIDRFAESLGFADMLGTPVTALENILFMLLVIILLSVFFIGAYRRLSKDPRAAGKISKRAMFVEVIVLFFEDFFGQIFGKKDVRRHLPFVGTLFIYILCLNMLGLLFLGKAPTANLSFNLGMAVLVFLYVHINAISKGLPGYLAHFPGTLPKISELGNPIGGIALIAFLSILMTMIHIMEMLIQPASLSLRLFGNMLGKDVLLGVFGGQLLQFVPLQTPFLFLGLLLGTVQALIFSLLSAVYITLWQPHEHHDEDHGHGHEAH